MNEITEVKKALEAMKSSINAMFDRLLLSLDAEEAASMPTEYTYPLSTDTNIFIGKKPIAVLFGDERADVKTWREVYSAILKRCNENPESHEMLMYLRNKVSGSVRMFLSDRPDGMRRPFKIDEEIFGECHYGAATLMHIMVNHILAPACFDCSNISIVMKI